MRCKFCFATFNDLPMPALPKGYLQKGEAQELIRQLKFYGFTKINFAGGEPLIHPHIIDHIIYAKSIGFITSIVTNGSKLDQAFLDSISGSLDYVGISIDSLDEHFNLFSGRAYAGKRPISREEYFNLCTMVKNRGIGLKVNTVVNAVNKLEDMSSFINEVKPLRWKIFQMLPIEGQNHVYADEFAVNDVDYRAFVERHVNLCLPELEIIPESNEIMTGSYLMIDPSGRFFDNTQGCHTYSAPILKAGVEAAIGKVGKSFDRYLIRKGDYFEKQLV